MNHKLSSSASHVAADADDGLPGLISVVDGLHGRLGVVGGLGEVSGLHATPHVCRLKQTPKT